MTLNHLRLIAAIGAAWLVRGILAPIVLLLQFLVILRGVFLVALILTTQALWSLRIAVLLAGALAAVLLLSGCVFHVSFEGGDQRHIVTSCPDTPAGVKP